MKKPIPFGKYYLLERINVGGMAEVFRAKAYGVEGFERLVAVKRILPNIAEDKEFIRMFIDEAKIAVQLNHANVAQIFDLGVVDSSYYIALEHIHGRDLRAIYVRCREHGQPMPIAQAAFVIMKVCEGLDYAHNKRDQSGRELGLVHRDVSPQNILVSFEGEVKLIDFGIAKAAGKGAKTQAGILKGKFGYMSPEQVRGLPIDRRSDIFSCGIVLYELLTGERLFVGESDFSTLEKVRNVEILPPSTYNRKIPGELERIVLKALTKDVEDRYLNAIDLHDDLQAFVYTAGEFYSRKDLAAWMKKTFSTEIEQETAKLESYRQLRPPDMRPPQQSRRPAELPGAPRRSTLAMPSVAPKPPPPPPVGNGRRSSSMAAQAFATKAPPPPPGEVAARPTGGNGLAWDEEELETNIYDEPHRSGRPSSQHAAAAAGAPPPEPPPAPAMVPPDRRAHDVASTMPLGSMNGPANRARRPPRTPARGVRAQSAAPGASPAADTAKGWESSTNPPGPATAPPPPGNLAAGSNPSRSPFPPAKPRPGSAFDGPDGHALGVDPPPRAEVASTGAFDDEDLPRTSSRKGVYIGIALAVVVLAVGGGIGAYVVLNSGDKGQAVAATSQGPGDPGDPGDADDPGQQTGPDQSGDPGGVGTDPGGDPGASDGITPTVAPMDLDEETLAKTGFDLVVQPAEVTVKLDGKPLDMTPPMEVRNVAPGEHELIINGPKGFFSKSHRITVIAGQADKIELRLEPVEVIGHFDSNPPGAKVTLLVDKSQEIPLGDAPVQHTLEPDKTYDVRFEKPGYVSKTEPVPITGTPEERIVAVLEAVKDDNRGRRSVRIIRRPPDTSGDKGAKSGGDADKPPASAAPGILMLNAKPPCEIYIDGKNTGKRTPQRSMKLPPGKHKVTLINNEFGIKESFTVTVESGKSSKHIKNFTDRINP